MMDEKRQQHFCDCCREKMTEILVADETYSSEAFKLFPKALAEIPEKAVAQYRIRGKHSEEVQARVLDAAERLCENFLCDLQALFQACPDELERIEFHTHECKSSREYWQSKRTEQSEPGDDAAGGDDGASQQSETQPAGNDAA